MCVFDWHNSSCTIYVCFFTQLSFVHLAEEQTHTAQESDNSDGDLAMDVSGSVLQLFHTSNLNGSILFSTEEKAAKTNSYLHINLPVNSLEKNI